METVTLKNGTVAQQSLVAAIMVSLRSLFDTDPIAAYEMAMKCRNPDHRCFGNSGEKLKQLGLLQTDDSVHDGIRGIVLSAVRGEGFEMSLCSPVDTGTKGE